MRGFGLIVVAAMLASCGNGENGDAPEPIASPDNDNVEQANAAEQAAPAPVSNAANSNDSAESASVSPCLTQGAERLEAGPLRAIGTEPFWSAHIEGRCVTYSTPEDQQGVRVWTRYSAGSNGEGRWVGQLDGKPFQLETRRDTACSDGMSDKRYPIAVDLTVKGEQRRGCAEPR